MKRPRWWPPTSMLSSYGRLSAIAAHVSAAQQESVDNIPDLRPQGKVKKETHGRAGNSPLGPDVQGEGCFETF
eukprot:SAG31_NODE_5682_length_2383_cov_1.567426_1_plen_73_part_00